MNYNELLNRLYTISGEESEYEAKILIESFTQYSHSYVLNHREIDLNSEELVCALERREKHEPLQYIIGKWEFYRQSYIVNENCLIPRSDTEILVEKAIELLPKGAFFLDLCTGSGCIAISTLAERGDTSAVMVDKFSQTLELAIKNSIINGVEKRAKPMLFDVLEDENELKGYVFDAILSNPPYIRPEVIETLSPEVKKEPYAALYGGDDGLIFYNKIVSSYSKFLKKDGFFLFEIGYDQADDLKKIAEKNGFDCEIFKDYGGNNRVALLKKSANIVDEAINFVKDFFQNEFTGHDYYHTMRVYNLATEIAKNEGADLEIVQLSALLHDVDDHKISPKTSENKQNARGFLQKMGVFEEKIEKICKIIGEISFSQNGEKAPESIEGKCVQDADRLDAIGAVGIARAFAFGGSRGRHLYNPDQKESNDSTIDHFYEKLFKLKGLMNTESAKRIATERDAFMQTYIKQFYHEWNGEK